METVELYIIISFFGGILIALLLEFINFKRLTNWFFMLSIVRNLEKKFHKAVCKAESNAEQEAISKFRKDNPKHNYYHFKR